MGSPRFLADLRSHALLDDSGGPVMPGHLDTNSVAFPLQDRVGIHKK